MEVRNEEMKQYVYLSYEQRRAVSTAKWEGRLEYYHGLDREWYNMNMPTISEWVSIAQNQKKRGNK